jgi:tRNA pseudouridine38-40 synthase
MRERQISDAKEINGTEWVSITFHGQSFMLHQIVRCCDQQKPGPPLISFPQRKMIGLLVLVGRLGAPASLIPELYGPARVHVPKAPGLGLLLEEPFFHGYNRKLEDARARPGGGQGEDREFVEYSAFKGQMDEFKQVGLRVRSRCRGRETDEAYRRPSSTIASCRRRRRRPSAFASPRRFPLPLLTRSMPDLQSGSTTLVRLGPLSAPSRSVD